VSGAILVHFLCTTLPISMYMSGNALADSGYISKDTSVVITKCVSIIFVAESFVNALVYIAKLPGFKHTILPKKFMSSVQPVTTVAASAK
jgi:hypothetical protein